MRNFGITKLPTKILLPFDINKNDQIRTTNDELKKITNQLKVDSNLPNPNKFGFSPF